LGSCPEYPKEDERQFYIADSTDFASGDKYNLNWQMGTEVKT